VLPEERAVVVGDENALYATSASLVETRWTRPPRVGEEITIKVRYRSEGVLARLEALGDGEAKVTFLSPAKAVAPGQAAVCYVGEEAIGGGFVR
jgi:tRNA-specific 2-thiouridylase